MAQKCQKRLKKKYKQIEDCMFFLNRQFQTQKPVKHDKIFENSQKKKIWSQVFLKHKISTIYSIKNPENKKKKRLIGVLFRERIQREAV